MENNLQTEPERFEPRLQVGLTVIIVVFLIWSIPDRVSLIPVWLSPLLGIIIMIPIAAIGITKAKPLWIKTERIFLFLFIIAIGIGNFLNLKTLISEMLYKSNEISGLELLFSSISVWVLNILMFSLLYWQIDRGSPEGRLNGPFKKPDWLFPQDTAPQEFIKNNWTPVFVDYLYLGYSTSSAFSTTEVVPITPRAKMLMMTQGFISLIVIVIVGARAINIIGS